MIYPKNFESKIGFDEVRSILRAYCLSTLGKELVDKAQASADANEINEWLAQTREYALRELTWRRTSCLTSDGQWKL